MPHAPRPVDYLVQIVSHTPSWVWGLLAALVLLGLLQSRPRTWSRARLLGTPIGLGVFSLVSMAPAVAALPETLIAWALAFGATLHLVRQRPAPAGTRIDPATGLVHLPGRWVPLMVMLSIFGIRYAVNVAQALNPLLRTTPGFAMPVALLYGALAGLLLGRTLSVLRAPRLTPQAA